MTNIEGFADQTPLHKILIPVSQILGGLYAAFLLTPLVTPGTLLEQLWKKIIALGVTVILFGIVISLGGLLARVVAGTWAGVATGLGVIALGVATGLFPFAHLLLRVRRINDLLVKDSGLTPEDVSLVQEDLRKGDQESVVQRITTAQEEQRTKFKEATGIDSFAIIPVIGQDIKWTDIVRQVFRVLEFDRADTTVLADGSVKAATRTEPYGYLLVESPILNVKARLPIIHRDDFLLAASVFDDPKMAHLVIDEELLVTYAPKHLLPKGLSGSPLHVLHYVITPRGTLDSYYSVNNDAHMAKPDPEKLFGPFVYPWIVYKYKGKCNLKVQMNPEPKL